MASIDELLELPDEFAGAWVPEKAGDTIAGTIVSRSSRDGGYGEYTILTIQPAKGDALAVHCAGAALKGKVQEKNPQVGDEIGIRFVGEATSKAGKTYKNYKVVVVKTTASETVINALNGEEKPF